MNKTYKITQSIGKLNASNIELPCGVPVDKSLYKMVAESKELRRWNDYGICSEEEITYYQDGESKYITIDGYTFDNRVVIYEKTISTQNRVDHTFTIAGKNPRGKIFEIRFNDEIKGIDSIVKVIYAMVITTLVGEDKAQSMWKNLVMHSFNYSLYDSLNIEEIITTTKEIKALAKATETKFPFLSLFFQNAIQGYINWGKSKLESFELFNS